MTQNTPVIETGIFQTLSPRSLRKTKIVVTVGPACADPKILEELVKAGADVFRINSSHATPESLREWIHRLRAAVPEKPILIDLQGPRIRTGILKDKKQLILQKDKTVSIVPDSYAQTDKEKFYVTTSCHELSGMVKKDDPILLDNGLMDLRVLSVAGAEVVCEVLSGGTLGENKGINLPNAPMTLPALSDKDYEILKVTSEEGADYIALSFVRTAQDIQAVKECLRGFGKQIPIIAKIEKPKAVELFDEIAAEAEGIMIARGDLGIELGVQRVPVIQKMLIERSNQCHLPVITATQMLESMMEHSRPTRAEASDVANAVFDGTDAVMLSGETSIGKYPVETVRTMAEIIIEAERHLESQETVPHKKVKRKDHPICAIAHAAENAAADIDAKAIIAFTQSGKTAISVSKFERHLPVLAFTPDPEVCRRLSLFHGVIPMQLDSCQSTDEMLLRGEQEVLKTPFLKEGDAVVVVAGAHALEKNYMVIIHWIGRRQ